MTTIGTITVRRLKTIQWFISRRKKCKHLTTLPRENIREARVPIWLPNLIFLDRLNLTETRMPSSRMRTARLLPVSQYALLPGGVPAWRECTCREGVYLPRWGCTCPGGVPARGVYLPGGVPARGYLPRYSPCEQNSWHTLQKILLCPKLRLRAVKTLIAYLLFQKIKLMIFFSKILLSLIVSPEEARGIYYAETCLLVTKSKSAPLLMWDFESE